MFESILSLRKCVALIGDGEHQVIHIGHELGEEIICALYDTSTGEQINLMPIVKPGRIEYTFKEAPAKNQYKVIVIG